jgi:hypothetical protein
MSWVVFAPLGRAWRCDQDFIILVNGDARNANEEGSSILFAAFLHSAERSMPW